MLGPAMALAWVATRFRAKIITPIVAAIMVALAVQTNLQARVWHDDVSLFEHSLAVAPRGVLALHNLGNYWAQHDKPQLAANYFQKALVIRPDHDESILMLGVTLAKLDRGDEAIGWLIKFLDRQEAMPAAKRAGTYPDVLFTVAETLLKRRDYATAAKYFRQRVELRPNDAAAHRDLLIAEQHLAASQPSQNP
jgi:tetratricopeptide (TPR) repeat protein